MVQTTDDGFIRMNNCFFLIRVAVILVCFFENVVDIEENIVDDEDALLILERDA